MPTSTRVPHNCRSIFTGLSLIICARIWIMSAVSLYEVDQTYGAWEKTGAVIVAAVNTNGRADVNNNETNSMDMDSTSCSTPDIYCAELNYTVSNEYISIISSITSDCALDPAQIPVGSSFELRYDPMNPRDFIKQSEYYDDITNLSIRIALAFILTMSLVSFTIQYWNVPDDVEGFGRDPRFGRNLEPSEPQESPEARKERILTMMIFQSVKRDLSNTTAAAVRISAKEGKSDETEAECYPAPVDEGGAMGFGDEDNSSVERKEESNYIRSITIENVDGTSCSPEYTAQENAEKKDIEEKKGGPDNMAAEIETATAMEQVEEPVDLEAQMATTNGEKATREDGVCCHIRPETAAENRTSAAGSVLQSMLSSWRRMEAEDSAAECCICLDGYNPGNIICVSKNAECNHVFHKDCIMDWMMKYHNQCPLCRVDLLK